MAKRIIGGAMAIALMSMGSVARAQETPEQEINQLLDHADQAMAEEGYHVGDWTHRNQLAAGRVERVAISLAGGAAYAIVGMCDTSCSNIDLAVYDANGNLVAQDVKPDDAPLIAIDHSGTYTLEIRMIGCQAALCSYAARSYRD